MYSCHRCMLSGQVFNDFFFGFPPDWESRVVNFFNEGATDIDSGNIITSNKEESKSPVTPIQLHREMNELSKHYIGGSASRKSGTQLRNIDSRCRARKVVTRPKTTKSNRKMTHPKSADPKSKMKPLAADSTQGSLSVERSKKRINFDSHVSNGVSCKYMCIHKCCVLHVLSIVLTHD